MLKVVLYIQKSAFTLIKQTNNQLSGSTILFNNVVEFTRNLIFSTWSPGLAGLGSYSTTSGKTGELRGAAGVWCGCTPGGILHHKTFFIRVAFFWILILAWRSLEVAQVFFVNDVLKLLKKKKRTWLKFMSHHTNKWKQEAHRPQLAHLSETATADMQMACNIFPILSNIETYDKAMA